jgi:hypothetical protein
MFALLIVSGCSGKLMGEKIHTDGYDLYLFLSFESIIYSKDVDVERASGNAHSPPDVVFKDVP